MFKYIHGYKVDAGTRAMLEDLPKLAGLIDAFEIDGIDPKPDIWVADPQGDGSVGTSVRNAVMVYFDGWHGAAWRERFAAYAVAAGVRAVIDTESYGAIRDDDYLADQVLHKVDAVPEVVRTRLLLVWGLAQPPGLGSIWIEPVPAQVPDVCPTCGAAPLQGLVLGCPDEAHSL